MNKVLRQGDVLLVSVDHLPATATESTEKDDIILAHGEVTGHAHRIKAPLAKAKLWDASAERFLQVFEKVSITHEEHAQIDVPPGNYRIAIQQEYSPAELRNVAD